MDSDPELDAFIRTLYGQSVEFRLSLFFATLAVWTFARGDINIAAFSTIDDQITPFLAAMDSYGITKIYDLPKIGWTAFAKDDEVTM